MKLENGDMPVNDSKVCDSTKYRTRMKKVAPPPPPPPAVPKPPPPLSNGSVRRPSSSGGAPLPTSTPGEDCAIDERLEGRMELEVVLPDCKVVRMTVDRRTPMMDLLVQATTSNKISPGGHVINVISKDERNISYKPNTPIGSLDASTVYIVPKSALELPIKRMPKLANQPFEQTFRLQVNLPHNQRMVLRVSPRITLSELKSQICSEKELDQSCHHLVHPAQPDTVLDLNATLEVYGCAEISLMSNSGLRDSIRSTSTNLFAYPRIEEEKKKKGILRLFSRKKKDLVADTPANGVNNVAPSQSESSTLNRNSYQPKQSIKRKPAPAPPPLRNSSPPLITQSSNSINSRPESEISVKTVDEVESSVSHSRHSSDSSGYHEPSVFSDCSENKSPETSVVHGEHVSVNNAHRQDSPLHKDYSDSVLMKRSSMTTKDTNLKNVPSCSNVSIVSASRKRKAPQPPVSTLPAIESPSSPEAPPLDSGCTAPTQTAVLSEHASSEGTFLVGQDASSAVAESSVDAQEGTKSKDATRQESEALQYLEDVLQESETCVRSFASQKIMDDSDTDSTKDEGEVISICQVEVHANANDQDSSDSVVEPHTVVTPDPVSPKSSFVPLSNPESQSAGCEVVDTSADDSGISQSLNSDADSSMPSINSDFKTMSDSGCQEEVYCNVTDSANSKIVPSDTECLDQSDTPLDDIKNDSIATACMLSSTTDSGSSATMVEKCSSAEPSPEVNLTEKTEKDSSCADQADSLHFDENSNVPSPQIKNISIEESLKFALDDSNSSKSSTTNTLPKGSSHNTLSQKSNKKLENFALGCYKKEDNIDIYSNSSSELDTAINKSQDLVKKDEKSKLEVSAIRSANHPVKIISFQERNDQECSESLLPQKGGRVQKKCAQLNNMSTLPLTGRCSSLYNLTPQKIIQKPVPSEECEHPTTNGIKRTQSDQNFANDLEPVEMKSAFLLEQKRLQEEYHRLQAQFISWQKQLLSNQSLLQNENILPHMPFPAFESLECLENISNTVAVENPMFQKSENIFDEMKTRSLPRPKTKPLSLKEPNRPKTPPLLQSPTEASVVDIDINSQENNRPDSLSCSVNTQANVDLKDKVIQVPSPQDKVIQVPSPQDKVTSGTQVPSPESSDSKEDVSAQTSEILDLSSKADQDSVSLHSSESDYSKSQTLPRPKPKPASAFEPSRTMTLNRNVRPKSQVVSVTIGSWQQRQTAVTDIEPSSVASSRSKFQSLENIPLSSNKYVPVNMEKRKLPPVPSEAKSSNKDVITVNKPKELVRESETVPKVIKETTDVKSKPSEKSDERKKTVASHEKISKISNTSNIKIEKTIPKQIEATSQKQKMEIKLSSKDPTALFRPAKPFVKLSSMKDESHPPSIIGLKKWPLSDIRENDTAEGRQSLVEDLKASSKRPGGYVQEKIRRAEVDLRKPKSSKTESATSPKAKDTKPEPSKLHITKVNINNAKDAEPSYAAVQKNKTHTSNVTTPVTGADSAVWNNTVPKSHSLNSELMAVFSKKAAAKDSSTKTKDSASSKFATAGVQNVTVNGSAQVPPPPPPPPPATPSSSAMPAIPPAEQIPVSTQLLMARGTKTLPVTKKESKKSPMKISRTADPREELMLEIRGFGGKRALRKVPVVESGWHLKVYGTASTANS